MFLILYPKCLFHIRHRLGSNKKTFLMVPFQRANTTNGFKKDMKNNFLKYLLGNQGHNGTKTERERGGFEK